MFPMATIPPLAPLRPVTPLRTVAASGRPLPDGDSWLTFNLVFVLAISGLVNVLLLLRLATVH